MNCPACSGTMAIIANRSRKLQPVVWRRRRCVKCSKVLTTYETIEAKAHEQDSALAQLDAAVATFMEVVDQVRWRLAVEQQVQVDEKEGTNGHQAIQ